MNEWDVVSQEPAPRAAPTQPADVDPWAVVQQSPAELPNRTVSEWMGDTGRRVAQTARTVTGGLLGLPTNLLNTVTANPRRAMELGNALRERVGLDPLEGGMFDLFDVRQQPEVVRGMRESIDISNEITEQGMTPQARQLAAELEAADGFLPTLGHFARNPAFALQEIVGQAPQLMQMVPGSLPGTIAAQMAGIGSQAEQEVFSEAMQRGMSEEEAAAAASDAFGLTAPVGAIGAAIPGGLAVERMLAGQLGQTTARSLGARAGIAGTALAGEGATEMVQEGAEQAIQNYVLGDPVTQGLGSAMAQGLVLGAGMGGPAGIAAGVAARSPGRGDGSGEGAGVEDPGYRVDPETGALEIDIVGGTRESEAGVQSPQAPSAAMAEPDLTPRAPATPTIEEGVTREQLVEEWRNAGTPDERAAAAARIAAYDAQRDDAGAADAGPVDADGAAGAQAEAAGLPAQDRGAAEEAALSPELIDSPEPAAGATGYVPEGTQPPPDGRADKAYLKQNIDTLPDPTPEQLPDDPAAYFNMRTADDVVPTSALIPSKQERASATALRRMAASADGFIPRRDAIDVRENEDGTYTILDGNGSHAAAQAMGLSQMPVRVVESPPGREGWRRPRGYLQGEASEALTRLYEASAAAKPEFDQIIESIASEFSAQPVTVPLKGRTRAEQKTRDENGGDVNRLNDILRGSIVLSNPNDAATMIDRLRQSGTVIKEKNAFDMSQPSPYWGGYRDAKVIFQMPNGARAEVILMTAEMEAAKERAHADYEIARAADAAIERGENVDENARAKAEAIARMEPIYAPAAEALRRAANSSSVTRQSPSGVNERARSESVGMRASGSYTTSTGAPPGPGTNAMGTSLSGGPPNSSAPGGGSAGMGVTPSENVRDGSATSGSPSSVSPTTTSVQDSGVSEQVQSAVRNILPGSARVSVVRSAADIPQDVRDRVRLTEAETDVEGFYDPDTRTAYIIEDALVPREGQPVEARAAWVAAHEWVGHHGLRELSGDQLGTVLRRARNNDTVAAVVRAMERQRPERGPALVEEALVELAAAVRTNDYAEISDRYGVEFTADSRGDLRRLIDRLLNALRRALGWDGFTDAELYDLIADSAAAAAGGPETVLVGDRAPRSRVGTRNPTAVRATESGVDPATTVGYESFRADPKAFERNTQLLLEYPGIRRPRGRVTPDRIAESFIEHSVANLLELHDRMPAQDRAVAKDWYVGANREAERLASEYGITDVQAAASIAALSPQKDWFQNLSLAERVIDASVNHADRAWDPGMSETLGNIFGGEKYGALRAAVEGRRLSDLSDPVERAAWIRTYDQTHNDSAFPITSPRGDLVGTQTTASGTPARIQWGSLAEVAKAVSVLEDGSLENVSALLGRQHKIRSFYNNIIEPTNDSDVTIDTHAVAAALLRPLSAATTEVGHNFGTGTSNSSVTGNSGMYGLYAEAYRRAAAERGVLPREMQSITWEAVRALYLPPSRRPNSRVVRDTEAAWNEYKQRRIEHGEAVERAVDAGGGIRRPDWAGSASRLDEGEWRRAFRPAVSGAGVPGRGAGPVASRGRGSSGADRGVHPDAAVTLNIGLSTAELRGGGELSRARVMRVLRRTGANVLADSRHVSDSEPTLVVDLDRPLTAEEGNEVSAALDQEAIVQRNVDGTGELFGPQAENWGPYNPAYFVMPDGDRADRGPVASRGRRTATGRRGLTARAFSGKPRQPDAVSADAYHYSNTPGLTELDPTFAGTAGAGRERRAFGMGRFGERGGTYARLNFYVREPGAPVPGAEDVVRGAGGSNLYRVQLDNLYDLDNDPRGIVADAGPNVTLMEEEIADAGFDGFLAGPQPGIDTPVAVVFDLPGNVPVENVDGSQPLPASQSEPDPDDPNAWWEQYEARRGAPRSTARRTAADARRERGKLFGRLAADGYRMGSPTQTSDQTGGRFATVKQARDAALIALHDKMLPLLRAQQQVAEDGRGISSITLDDAMNAYRAENLMHGAVNDELTGLHYRHIRPIQEAIRKSPYSVDMFEDYLYAKAAPERNREIAKINKAMPDAGSGITTQMAKDIMAGKADGVFSGKRLTPEAIALFDDLNKHVRALRDAALNNMIDAGQITPELAASLRKKYPNYVPMRGKDAELDEGRGSRPGTGRGLSQRRANIRRALGRGADNVPVNILGELVGDAQRSVVAKGKAKVARAMLRFALANPNPDLYTVEPVDLEWRFSEATGEAYLGVKRRGEDVDTSMVIMHKGNPVYLRFNDPQLAAAMLNAGVEDMGKMMRVFSALNRWRSATLTRYNPAFTPVNMARDFHFGTVAIAAEHGPRIAAQTVMNYPGAMRASYRHAAGRRGDASKPDSEKTMQDWAAEAYAAGMSTGITHTPNVVDLQRNLQAATMGVMELAASGRPLAAAGQALYRTGRPIIDAIENANEASENAMRLGVYVALRKDGMSKTRAAEYAKNVTINFNRKGKAGPILNAIFLFYNAAMQGGHAVLRVMRNPKVMTYLIGLSIMQGLLSAGLMDDDDGDGITEWDKIPDYVKRTSLIFPLSEGKYFAMPMPYGFNWFTYLGGRGTQRMILGDRPTDSSIMVDLAKSLSEAFSPIPFEDGYRSLFGDQVGLAMGLAANRDDFGSPIAQLNPYEQYPEPRALQGRVTTPGMYHVMAQLMAKAGGGDLDERLPPIGWLDVAPEQIEELVNHFGGGITSLGNRGLRAFEQMQAGNLDGAFEGLSAAPITSRLLVSPSEARAIADRYYSERGEFARHKAIVDNRIAQGMPLDEAIADRPPEYFTGAQQATYQRHGRRQDGTRYRRGEGRVDSEGNPIIEYTEGSPRDVLKSANRRVSALNEAVREIRAATITNAELAEMYAAHYDAHTKGLGQVGAIDGVTGRPADIGLPDDFDGDATAPARVRNRAIKILQDMRAEEQRRLLRSIEYERKLQSVRR